MRISKARIISALLFIIAPLLSVAQFYNIPVQELELIFAGDLMQHKEQLQAAKGGDGKYSYSGYYRYIREIIEDSDIAVANLETPIGTKGFSGYPSFCAPDSFLYAAAAAGFNTILLANNHCLDRGRKGAMHTLSLLDSLGLQHCGVYRDAEEREERYPLLINRNGVRIALLNYTYGTNGYSIPEPMIVNIIDKEVMAKDIAKAKSMNADAIIACMHWGDEYVSIPPGSVKKLAGWLLEQGVDHIIGNHPHVIQPIEIRDDEKTPDRHAVVYSTGNLVSNMSLRRTDGGIMVRMGLRRILNYTQLKAVDYILTWIAPKKDNGKRDYTILPAATTIIEGDPEAKDKLRIFLEDSRTLMRLHNKGERINEFLSDTVRVVR